MRVFALGLMYSIDSNIVSYCILWFRMCANPINFSLGCYGKLICFVCMGAGLNKIYLFIFLLIFFYFLLFNNLAIVFSNFLHLCKVTSYKLHNMICYSGINSFWFTVSYLQTNIWADSKSIQISHCLLSHGKLSFHEVPML